jgi:predicted PurR-regulated permease PerM
MYFNGILIPLVVALFVWYIIKELRRALGKIKIRGRSLPQWFTGLAAMLIIVLFIISIFELISSNIEQISNQGPHYKAKLDELVNTLSATINNPKILEYIRQTLRKLDFASIATGLVNSLSLFVTDFTVVLVYIIFMLLEETAMRLKMHHLFPSKNKQFSNLKKIMNQVDAAVRSYLVSMILISFITAVISYIALLILGVDFPILWAFLIFFLNFIPYIGPFISSLLPALLAIFQFGDLFQFVYVFLVLEGIQIILGNFVQPKMMGKSLNISPLTVLISLALWGFMWGVTGMILSVPITSIMIIIMARFPGTRYIAILMSENGEVGD